jgi:hypothetical protein
MATEEKSAVINEPGVYEHKETGKRMLIAPDPTVPGSKSTAAADAAVRMGFVKVAEHPTSKEVADMQAAQAKHDAKHPETAPYLVPGSQEVVHNGTADDVNGPGDRETYIEQLHDELAEAQATIEKLKRGDVDEEPTTDEAKAETAAENATEDAAETETNETEGK